ncbi:MAG: allophycocyanin subunit beta [Spirulina sp. SIO3F2]|nr:allophycocyanin subunit beta [Spirulina sp. SIO3F2]
MRDAVTSLIQNYDLAGRYFDRNAMDSLKAYFASGQARIAIAGMITSNAAEIVKTASARLFEQVPELLAPGGNAYTTRRYSACLRDLDYYLRYASYALVAADNDVLSERVLEGLRETYNSLEVPIGPTVQGIAIMKDVVKEMADAAGVADTGLVDAPFDYICRDFGEKDI